MIILAYYGLILINISYYTIIIYSLNLHIDILYITLINPLFAHSQFVETEAFVQSISMYHLKKKKYYI